jgi:hypothetical protein
MRRAFPACWVLGITFTASVAAATPIDYTIAFTNQAPGSPGGTPVGAFSYDADASLFSNFRVNWNSRIYDLTDNANCIPSCTTGSILESFQLLTHTLPDGAMPTTTGHYGYYWNSGIYSTVLIPNTSVFSFGFGGEVLYAASGSHNGVSAYGTWSVSPPPPPAGVPDQGSTVALLTLSLILMVAARRRLFCR